MTLSLRDRLSELENSNQEELQKTLAEQEALLDKVQETENQLLNISSEKRLKNPQEFRRIHSMLLEVKNNVRSIINAKRAEFNKIEAAFLDQQEEANILRQIHQTNNGNMDSQDRDISSLFEEEEVIPKEAVVLEEKTEVLEANQKTPSTEEVKFSYSSTGDFTYPADSEPLSIKPGNIGYALDSSKISLPKEKEEEITAPVIKTSTTADVMSIVMDNYGHQEKDISLEIQEPVTPNITKIVPEPKTVKIPEPLFNEVAAEPQTADVIPIAPHIKKKLEKKPDEPEALQPKAKPEISGNSNLEEISQDKLDALRAGFERNLKQYTAKEGTPNQGEITLNNLAKMRQRTQVLYENNSQNLPVVGRSSEETEASIQEGNKPNRWERALRFFKR